MKFHKQSAWVFVPDSLPTAQALERTTHLAVAAHQDDIEIMAIGGILECYRRPDRWFTGVVATDGAGSPREGFYRDYSDEEMRAVRAREQIQAASLGEYGALCLLDYSSAEVKEGRDGALVGDLTAIFEAARPQLVYTHNLADKHPTHVATALRTVEALRSLPRALWPERLIGCEVWRDLDWMPDEAKVIFDCSNHEGLQTALLGVFDSQVSGGKRYDLATMGRRRAHATFFASQAVDDATGMTISMDLTPLIQDPELDVLAYVGSFIDRFAEQVHDLISGLR